MNSKDKKQPVFIVTGGTGGHVFPSVALWEEIHDRGIPVIFLCDSRGRKYLNRLACLSKTSKIVQFSLPSPEGNLFHKLSFSFFFILASLKSLVFMIREFPRAVICFGGYISIPGGLASILSFRKLFLHEQNVSIGLGNRLLIPFARKLAVSYSLTQELNKTNNLKISVTGLPIRVSFKRSLSPSTFYLPKAQGKRFLILILGGSQGSESLVRFFISSLIYIPIYLQDKIYLVVQSPKTCKEELYKNFKGKIYTKPFFEDVVTLLRQANLIISRCGASSLAEIATSARPSVLIPYPYSKRKHQIENAGAHVNLGSGWMLLEQNRFSKRLGKMIVYLIEHPSALLYASERVIRLVTKNSSKKLTQLILGE